MPAAGKPSQTKTPPLGGAVKPKGAPLGTRVTQASKTNPQRFPERARTNRKADVTVYLGLNRKKRYTIPLGNVDKTMQRYAANQVRAKAHDAMSGDVVGESFKVTRIGRPDKWTSYSST